MKLFWKYTGAKELTEKKYFINQKILRTFNGDEYVCTSLYVNIGTGLCIYYICSINPIANLGHKTSGYIWVKLMLHK